MARLVAAFGSSHSPMLAARAEDWNGGFLGRDRTRAHVDLDGNPCGYEALLANAPSDAVALAIPPPSVVDSASEPLPVASAVDFEPFLPSASAEHSLPSDPMLVTVPEVETQLAPVGGIFILA